MIFLSCLLSAVLLVLSLPRAQWWLLAWVALVPMFFLIDNQRPWRAFRRAWLCGFLFFALSLGWIIYVTWIGAILLAAFLALYFGLFAACFVYFQGFKLPARLLILSAVWVVLEYIRAHFLSGMGWVMLGHTQYKNLWLIQICAFTGVYGVSFLVILGNLLFFETWKARRFLPGATVITMLTIGAVLIYGWHTLVHAQANRTITVGLVQPNIPLADTWDDALKPGIVEKTIQLTDQFKGQPLDLIAWPETALPGVISDSPLLMYEIRSTAARMQTPILMGSIAQDGNQYFNSAFLVGADGQMHGRYDKIHLVPFGEYLPVRPLLGWINRYVPIDDFNSGTRYTIFSIGTPAKKFGVLICFEDTLAELSRRLTRQGAEFFVNITNDAWFQKTRAPYLHLQGAVFGCVENHRALARAANTGVTAIIDPWGRITSVACDSKGHQLFTKALLRGTLPLMTQKTFYTKYGDIFTCLCFLCILLASAFRKNFI